MSMVLSAERPWHEGEVKMHEVMRSPRPENPSSPFLLPRAAYMLSSAPLLAIGTVDKQGRPWSSVYGGSMPFAQAIGENLVGVKTMVDSTHDPVMEALMDGRDGDGKIELNGNNMRMVSGLTIDLETRKRIKLGGRMMAGLLDKKGKGDEDGVAEATLVVRIDESLGNCPKYLNKKHISSADVEPKLLSDSAQLSDAAVSLIEKADLFFISSSHGTSDMDTNHRGGPAGFVRVISNESSGASIVWPEYSGNRLYQTLGNLQTTPLAGLVFPDFETGDVLYLTGTTETLVGQDAAALLPRSNLAVKVNITSGRLVQSGLNFRGEPGDPSPYNPALRYATTEKNTPGASLVNETKLVATMISKEILTPTIARFRFSVDKPSGLKPWQPGQYATLSFADDLDIGYSHMRDDDPRSLNDDWVRTFTISSPPSRKSLESGVSDDEFELTIRNVGAATQYLFRQNPRAAFELPLLGFEGEFAFPKKGQRSDATTAAAAVTPMIAAGIGITPVLGQLEDIDLDRFSLLWTTGIVDIGLVEDTFKRYPGLVQRTRLFVTGKDETARSEQLATLKKVEAMGADVSRRRLNQEDIERLNTEAGDPEEWYMCVGPALKPVILQYLSGKSVNYEDFNY